MRCVNAIITCPPTYFSIAYEINPWMHKDVCVDKNKARQEYKALQKVYRNLSVPLYELAPVDGLPDMVYASDWGFSIDDMFIRANHKNKERRQEVEHAARFAQETLKMNIVSLPSTIYFEGEGDLLRENGTFFYGYGQRSQQEAKPYLEKLLNSNIIDLELINPSHFHLDTALGILSHDTAVCVYEAFSRSSLQKLQDTFSDLVPLPKHDIPYFGTNFIIIDNQIIVSKGISQELKKVFQSCGYHIIEIETSEYLKGGGSISCMSHLIYNS
ncbi:hypothetical protein KC726_03430 [Candidatus Woesebacteria bacterium]|nr:hypothetical protein [Candidatus Woesebacteria bacterium]